MYNFKFEEGANLIHKKEKRMRLVVKRHAQLKGGGEYAYQVVLYFDRKFIDKKIIRVEEIEKDFELRK